MVGPKITIGDQETVVDTVICVNNGGECLDPNLKEFLKQSQTREIAACIYEKQNKNNQVVRKNLLIIDNRASVPSIGHYDLGALPRTLPPDILQALDQVFSNQYQLIDITRDIRLESFHESGGDVRFDGKQLGIQHALHFVAKRMNQGRNLQVESEAPMAVELASPSRSGFFNFNRKAKAAVQNVEEKTSHFGLSRHQKDKE